MRKIIGVILTMACMAACTSIDCPVQNAVYTTYALKKAGGTADDTLGMDTLYVAIIRADGTDSLILNGLNGGAVTRFELPISYTQPEDVFYTLLRDTAGNNYQDTIRIKKENYPHFESVDCQVAYFHKITDASTTHNAIDSIIIHQPDVNYDVTNVHFYLYIKD